MPAAFVLCLTSVACGFAGEDDDGAAGPLLRPGDRVAFVGGGTWEKERRSGMIEAAFTLAEPNVTFRHLGWAGDMADQSARRFFGTAEDGREHLLEHVDLVKPTVVWVAYGRAESLPGGMSVEAFRENLASLLGELEGRTKRIFLVEPQNLPPSYAAVIRDLAKERGSEAIPIDQFVLATMLLLTKHSEFEVKEGVDRLLPLITRKNDLFFQRHRPQNETYLRGFRAHEQGNNAAEIARFEPLVAAKDAEIQSLRTQIVKDQPE